MDTRKRRGFVVLLAVLCFLALAAPAFAKAKTGWVKKSSGDRYLKAGKAVTGVVKIGGKTFYFDPEGIQRTGWHKIHNKYYFFRQGRGKKGYLLKSRRIDGIWVNAEGKADVSSEAARRKLDLMAGCQKLAEHLTEVGQSKAEKREILFRFMMYHYTGQAIPSLGSRPDLDVTYAKWLLSNEVGDCYAFGALYAYLLNAVGYDNPLFVCSGGHGWTELGGLVYDTHWSRIIGFDKCFGVPSYLSGQGGRPAWFQNRLYVYSVNDSPRE